MITAAAVGILLSIDAQRFSIAACCLIDVCLLCVLVMLLVAFFRQMQYNPYSYNTIYYIGFALVVLSVLAMSIIGTVRMIFSVQTINLETIFGYLQNSAKLYMLLSFPFVLVFSAGLCVSNIALIRHEGFSPVNALGILLSFLMLAGDVFLFFADYYVSGSMLYVILTISLLYLMLMVKRSIMMRHRPMCSRGGRIAAVGADASLAMTSPLAASDHPPTMQ
ncbi:MAG: hypothetical protein IJT44_07530 [Clostridia bacterium]|nr:hypothetical protein [Clostridia bacterium]